MQGREQPLAAPVALTRPRTRSVAAGWVDAIERIDIAALAGWLGAGILLLAALGAIQVKSPGSLPAFDLDKEFTVPATWSALLDVGAAVGAEALRRRTRRNALLGLVVLFAFMGLDEFSAIHEHLEKWTGVDWMKLYIPIFIYAGVAWIAVLRQVRNTRFWLSLWGGAACWVIAQIFELLEWKGNVKQSHYGAKMFCEEILEMAGSALFLLGMLVALRAWQSRRGASNP